MLPLDDLHVEVESASLWIGAYCSISRICQGTALAVAETSNVVFVAAKVLLFGGSLQRG